MTKVFPLELKDVVSPEILAEVEDVLGKEDGIVVDETGGATDYVGEITSTSSLVPCPECGAIGSSTDFAATQKIVEIDIKRWGTKSREQCFRSARLNPDCPTCSSFEKGEN